MQTRRQQRKTIIIGYVLMIPLAVMIVLTALGIDVFAAFTASDDKICAESAETPEKALFEGQSGMPCENPAQFERWYTEYEQTTSEEKDILVDTGAEGLSDSQADIEESTVAETESETAQKSDSETASREDQAGAPAIYRIDGEVIAPEIQQKLYAALDAAGIAYWYETSLCQMYQESRGQQYAENPNGLDKGLFQFRAPYWGAPESIFDVDAQIMAYTEQTAARLNAGLSADEVISRHNTSDYCPEINAEYVAQVRQWLVKMEVVE